MTMPLPIQPYLRVILSCLFCYASALIGMEKPNVVVILADDMGLGDVGRHHLERTGNQPLAPTPAIDALANEGLWFTDAHSPAALCAPSRYSLMTGNYNFRSDRPSGVWGTFDLGAIAVTDTTLGSVAQTAGYTTGFVGKWHLGGDFYKTGTTEITRQSDAGSTPEQVDMSTWVGRGPQQLGFNYDFTVADGVQGPTYVAHENGLWYPLGADSALIYYNNAEFVSDKGPGIGDSNWNGRELNMLLANKAAAFITSSAASTAPFMLYYCSPAVHLPHTPPVEIDGEPIAGTTPSAHLDMNRVLDLEVKAIVDALKASGVYENTLIIFTSDNGGLNDSVAESAGHRSSGGFRGTKNSQYEGGHRVPFIAVWPSVISADTSTDSFVNGSDILATIVDVMGSSFPDDQAMDSHSLFPLFLGNTSYEPRAEMLQQGGSGNELMLRQGPWKLIIESTASHNVLIQADTTAWALFNLDENPTENAAANLFNEPVYASRVTSMYARYWEIRESSTRSAPAHGTPLINSSTALLAEDFSSIANSKSFGIGAAINDDPYNSGLRFNNHAVGQVTTNTEFGNGHVLQVFTGTNPDAGFGAVSTQNNPFPVSLNIGDELTLSFDMLVQAVPTTINFVNIELRMTDAAVISRTFTEYTSASVGESVAVSWTTVVDADLANASDVYFWIPIEGIPSNYASQGPNNDGTDLAVMQLDNIAFTLNSATGYQQFADSNALAEGPTGDDDGDALLNVFEYAYGSDPQDNSSARSPNAQVVEDQGNQYLEMNYSRRKSANNYSALRVWRSTELADQSWKLGETKIISITDDAIQADLENVVERSIYPIGTNEKEFFRMDVIIAP
jgi:arylsulfatase A